jgi:hypothetical protein
MCDLKTPGTARRQSPKGLAFDIADHMLISAWAELNDLRLCVRLDHGAAVGDDHEEVVAFQAAGSPLYRLILWRNDDAVFVQPFVGQSTQHRSVAEALDSMLPAQTMAAKQGRQAPARLPAAHAPRLARAMTIAASLVLMLVIPV